MLSYRVKIKFFVSLCLVTLLFIGFSAYGGVMVKYSQEEKEKWKELVTSYVENHKQWKREDFRVTLDAIKNEYKIAIFTANHREAIEEREREIRETGTLSKLGLSKMAMAVFVDIEGLKAYELTPDNFNMIRKKNEKE